jgi:excisionase family DNA binding protein
MAELLSVEEVAAQLHVKPRTVMDWLRVGKLAGYKIGRLWRVDPTALEAFLSQHKWSAGDAPAAEA